MYPDISESENFPLWIQKFPRPHVCGFTISSSANCKAISASCEQFLFMLQKICFSDNIVPPALFRSFNLFTGSNSSVRHRKKPQNVEPSFGIGSPTGDQEPNK